jgi:hypothetical protein
MAAAAIGDEPGGCVEVTLSLFNAPLLPTVALVARVAAFVFKAAAELGESGLGSSEPSGTPLYAAV